jgi:hypothetical protein
VSLFLIFLNILTKQNIFLVSNILSCEISIQEIKNSSYIYYFRAGMLWKWLARPWTLPTTSWSLKLSAEATFVSENMTDIKTCTALFCGPDSSVGIATGYGLDGPVIESRWGEIFRTCPDRPWGPRSLLYNEYRVFPGGKMRLGHAADHSPPSNASVMEE